MEPDEIINQQAQAAEPAFVSKVTMTEDRIEVTHGGISAVVTSPTGIAQINKMLAQVVLQAALDGQEHWKHCDMYADSADLGGIAVLGGNGLRRRDLEKRAMSEAEKARFGVLNRA